ncbi:hypothetical protein QOZ80_2AG0115760 [Eleusine coracana subsp. coracana]|nr:hypothetical protein QOZ80_2AG0115760 [Eleusine coracana subsp. coracana]
MDARVSKEWENPFSVTATMGEILEVQPSGGGGEREPEKVFVAVPEQYKHGKSVLAWALRHAAAVVVVLMHIHVPAQMIPMMGSKFHVSKLRPEHVSAYRQYEKEKIEKLLDEYIQQCSKMKVKCEKLVIENAHIAKGITELVSMHGVTKLVMGAAADKNYSRKMKMPKSKTALAVLQRADISCKIWFVCKEHLIYTRDDVSEILHPVRAGCDLLNPVSYHEQGAIDPNTDLFDKLEETFTESDKFQRKAFDESLRRQKGEEELTLFKKVNQKKEVETALAKANEDIEVMKQEMDALKQDRDDIIDKFIQMSEQKAMLEKRVNEYDDELRKEKDKALSCSNLWNTEFSLSELKQATQDFCDTMKVGEGGFGRVYKGHLRNTTVAIKMLRSHNVQGQSQFQQEVVVLSKVRHPNLVTLIGTCSEASGLVYEFLPNGSLEDRLACANNTPPLAWQVRTRIIGEICAALIFLHSNKPHPVIHGDLKPANILLDANLVSKLCDFGISCLLNKSSTMSTSLYQTTNPRGTFAYMDPEFLTTGELTARSDIYSFGILILQLVTGKPALGIGRAVEDALDKDELELLVDKSAGRWPFDQAKKLMLLGLHCVELSRRRRPDRMSDVWCVVEPLVKSALSVAPPSFGHRFVEDQTPSYFLCPISQEVMRNPHVAADGFTYEAEVIKGWLDSGRNTSPMTKSRLAHQHLTPNHALRSAIQEYFQQQQ